MHTDGPWVKQGQSILSDRPYPHWKLIAEVRIGDKRNWDDPEGEANGRLIAAAPDLLDALRQAVTALNVKERFKVQGTDSYAIAALCDKAIAKAEGRSE